MRGPNVDGRPWCSADVYPTHPLTSGGLQNLLNIRTYAGKTFPLVLRSLPVMEIPDRISIEVLETTSMCPSQSEHTYRPFYVGDDVHCGVGSGSQCWQ
jgi:hypothetical protein